MPERTYFAQRLSRLYLGLAIAFVALIGWLDSNTSEDLSLYIFYALPIFIGSWFSGFAAGLLLSVLSALTWLAVDHLTRVHPSSVLLYWNGFVRGLFFSTISYSIAMLKQTLDRERAMAAEDHLTGIANRRKFFEFAVHELERSRRYHSPFSFAFLDLDNFKELNDFLGHRAGDELLCIVAHTVKANIRSVDLAARLGGDEFAIFFPETGSEAASKALKKIKQNLETVMAQRKLHITFSIGLVTYITLPESIDEVIAHADRLMYRGKESGKNTIVHETVSPSGWRSTLPEVMISANKNSGHN